MLRLNAHAQYECMDLRSETKSKKCASDKNSPTGRDRNSISISVVTSLVPRLTIVIFGLGTRLLVRMRTNLQNGVLRNGQQPQSVVNGFY